MDTLFSHYRLSGTRLAQLLATSPRNRNGLVASWHPANDNQQQKSYRNYYQQARSSVVQFHRGEASEEDLRRRAAAWERDSNPILTSNARAVVQYLDEHARRVLVVLKQQTLEAYISGLRVSLRPHLVVHEGARRIWIWLDCRQCLDDSIALAKANVTRLIATQMGLPNSEYVEVIHSATRRIVIPDRSLPELISSVTALCAFVRDSWGYRESH